MFDSQRQQVLDEIRQRVLEARNKPFRVAVMGQTGVGKSSLINALFGTKLKTDPVRPCTMRIEDPVRVRNEHGHELWFHDLPGVGESAEADVRYLDMYVAMLRVADVVLWLLHADSRSVMFDLASLESVFGRCPPEERSALINKVTFVLSKADLIGPPAWVCGRDGERCALAPQAGTRQILDAKAAYFEEVLLSRFAAGLRTSTYADEADAPSDSRVTVADGEVTFRGHLTEAVAAALKRQSPRSAEVVERLRANHRVIPCSSQFRFNLYEVLLAIVNKLGLEATERFKGFFGKANLNELPLSRVRELCNLVVVDQRKGKVLFNLTTQVL